MATLKIKHGDEGKTTTVFTTDSPRAAIGMLIDVVTGAVKVEPSSISKVTLKLKD